MWHPTGTNMPRIAAAGENKLVTSTITPQEIKDKVLHLDPSKVLGHDRFRTSFFLFPTRNIGPLLVMILLTVFQIFFQDVNLLKEVHHAPIILVLKSTLYYYGNSISIHEPL